MKTILSIFTFVMTLSFAGQIAHAQIAASENPMDSGIAAGALFSKVKVAKLGENTFHVIATDLIEPACNSVQIIVWVSDANLEGDAGGVTYNLGKQVSKVTRVRAVKNEVLVTYQVKNIDDCSTSTTETMAIQYPGAGAPLVSRMVK